MPEPHPVPSPAPGGAGSGSAPGGAPGTAPGAAPGPASRRPINLALQGGGSHGAFTWGVLDSLLAEPGLEIEGLSGTSAGAVNAVALACGYARGKSQPGGDPRWGGRTCLARVWDAIGRWGALGDWQGQFSRELWGAGAATQWLPGQLWAQAISGLLSPYQLNPLDFNPLRQLLREEIDFAAIRRAGRPRVFVSATHVATGKAVVFTGRDLDARAVTASACLPTLFQAVEIGGQAYWDGGYSVNPALSPLIAGCTTPDILVVQINPLVRPGKPETATEILDRMNELNFNASLMTQMRGIDRINRLLAQGALTPGCNTKPVRLHRIDGGPALLAYKASSKLRSDPELLQELFEIGRAAGQAWLRRHLDDVGRRSTVDVARDYEDDTRTDRPRPWLARLLARHVR